jgi:hypothetical protein
VTTEGRSAGEAGALIKAAYEAHRARIKASLVLEYRCPQRGCLLLHVWLSPAGLMYYNPAPRLLAAGLLEDADPSGLPLECDHMRIYIARDVLGMVLEKVHPGTPVRHVIW